MPDKERQGAWTSIQYTELIGLWILRFPGLKQSQACGQAAPIKPVATTRKSEQLLDWELLGDFFFNSLRICATI